MHVRAVGNRCAVHIPSLELPIPESEALRMLETMGYRRLEIDMVAHARERIGRGAYRRGARMHEAPNVFDCSSFVKWLYGMRGIHIPRYSIQQFEKCYFLPSGPARAGDLAFSAGHHSYYRTAPTMGIGHVGIVTADQTVIHAANSEVGIIEERLDVWNGWTTFRGVRRLFPSDMALVTLECPPDAEVESSDDLRWKILQRLPR